MKPNLLVLVAAAVPVAVLFAAAAAAPTAPISELEGAAVEKTTRVRRTWPCCDRCGGCSTNSDPPECQCHDLVRRCHPSCRSCVRSPLSVEPPLFQCTDRIPGYCRRRCNSDHGLQILYSNSCSGDQSFKR